MFVPPKIPRQCLPPVIHALRIRGQAPVTVAIKVLSERSTPRKKSWVGEWDTPKIFREGGTPQVGETGVTQVKIMMLSAIRSGRLPFSKKSSGPIGPGDGAKFFWCPVDPGKRPKSTSLEGRCLRQKGGTDSSPPPRADRPTWRVESASSADRGGVDRCPPNLPPPRAGAQKSSIWGMWITQHARMGIFHVHQQVPRPKPSHPFQTLSPG